jgi:hypothetical protein
VDVRIPSVPEDSLSAHRESFFPATTENDTPDRGLNDHWRNQSVQRGVTHGEQLRRDLDRQRDAQTRLRVAIPIVLAGSVGAVIAVFLVARFA